MFPITVQYYKDDVFKKYKVKTKKSLINKIYDAWNYESDIETEDGKPILIPYEDESNNREWLAEFGLGLTTQLDHHGYSVYKIYDLENGKVYNAPWDKV